MTCKSVFVALVEVKPLNGCELDPHEIEGACVRCYVSAETESSAIEAIKSALSELCFKVETIEWCVNDAEVEWEDPSSPEGRNLVDAANRLGDVQFGEFYAWTDDDDS
jgi:hypothetical protein